MAKTATGSRAQQAGKPRLLLASVDSFYGDEKGLPPSYASLLFTIGFVIIFLVLVEETLRLILISWQVRRNEEIQTLFGAIDCRPQLIFFFYS